MERSNVETSQPNIKAARAYKTIDSANTLSLTGKKIHFIGVGGVGMSGLAKLMIQNKAVISGSDQIHSAVTDNLSDLGADIRIGHNFDNLSKQTDAVVYSAAIKDDNPEIITAKNQGLQIYKYAQMLGILSNHYETIAIAGTHGKSTAAAWLTYCLKNAGIDTNFLIGADITQLQTSSGVGNSGLFIAEACEYDRSFLNLNPKIACILNIDDDHLDYYKDTNDIIDSFTQFALNTEPTGLLIANSQDPNTAKLLSRLPAGFRCRTFGFDKNCNFSAQNIQLIDRLYSFDLYQNEKFFVTTQISLPGKHNILNALAVVAIAANLGIEIKTILNLLGAFSGIDRRLMLKEKFNDITVIDDYAHHPTEIKASLEAIRQKYQPKKLCCVFQPHQYSRTRFLLDDFAKSFKLADITIIPEIYFVRDTQQSKKQINSLVLVEKIKNNHSDAVFIDSFENICNYLKENVTAGDLVVTMGAGDIWKVADEYIQWLRTNS